VVLSGVYLFILQLIDVLKKVAHDWFFGRHDPAGGRRWVCCDVIYSAAISNVAAQKERRQVSGSQHCTQRRSSDLILRLSCVDSVICVPCFLYHEMHQKLAVVSFFNAWLMGRASAVNNILFQQFIPAQYGIIQKKWLV